MFDANMRHLPKGYKFFAKCWGNGGNEKLINEGIGKDSIFLCTMLSKGSENPAVMIGNTQLTNKEIFYDSTIFYCGSLDGTGFYPNFPEDRVAAFKLIGGEWEK